MGRKETIEKYNAKPEVKERNREFLKNNYKQIIFRLRVIEDAHIIGHLAKQENTSEYIKGLIIKDIYKE